MLKQAACVRARIESHLLSPRSGSSRSLGRLACLGSTPAGQPTTPTRTPLGAGPDELHRRWVQRRRQQHRGAGEATFRGGMIMSCSWGYATANRRAGPSLRSPRQRTRGILTSARCHLDALGSESGAHPPPALLRLANTASFPYTSQDVNAVQSCGVALPSTVVTPQTNFRDLPVQPRLRPRAPCEPRAQVATSRANRGKFLPPPPNRHKGVSSYLNFKCREVLKKKGCQHLLRTPVDRPSPRHFFIRL